MTNKVIIDTDPGIDDAMAIYFAVQAPQIDLLGLTTVFGNIEVELATQNALRLLEHANIDLPVCKGVAMPHVGPESTYAKFVHGEDGLGNLHLPPPKTSADQRTAAEFIIEMAHKYPNEITLVPIGPLGNIALALKLEPKLPELIKSVNIMGGAAHVAGNVTPVAEANIWNDAYAAEIVFSAGWDVKMFGLDVTYATSFDPDFVDILAAKNPVLGGLVARASQFYIDFYSKREDKKVCFFHDAFPLAYIVNPDLFTLITGNIRIGTDPLHRGQTSFAPLGSTTSELWTETPPVKVATGVNHAALTQLFIDTYAR